MNTVRLEIENRKGLKLKAYFELPANQKPNHFAIFADCFSCNSNFNAVKNISRSLSKHGFGVLRFDFTGLGKSECEFAESHFSANVEDLLDVSTYLEKHYKAPALLVGHSLGGAAVIVAASKLESVKALATLGATATVNHVTHLFSHAINDIPEKGEIEVQIGGRPFKINQDFVADFNKTDLPKIIKELREPILVLHAPFDKIVGIENAHQIYHNAMHPKSFVRLDSANYLLSKPSDSSYVGNMIGTWVERYFEPEENSMISTEAD